MCLTEHPDQSVLEKFCMVLLAVGFKFCRIARESTYWNGDTAVGKLRVAYSMFSPCILGPNDWRLYDTVTFPIQAACWGHSEAAAAFGQALELGMAVNENLRAAAAWYRRAALSGSARGANNLGKLFFDGRGVSKVRRPRQITTRCRRINGLMHLGSSAVSGAGPNKGSSMVQVRSQIPRRALPIGDEQPWHLL